MPCFRVFGGLLLVGSDDRLPAPRGVFIVSVDVGRLAYPLGSVGSCSVLLQLLLWADPSGRPFQRFTMLMLELTLLLVTHRLREAGVCTIGKDHTLRLIVN